MELALSADEQAFQTEVRDFLKAELPADIADRVKRGLPVGRQDMLRWHEPLRAQGWLAASWPKSAGGPGWTIMQRHIFDMECRLAHAPPLIAFNFNMIGLLPINSSDSALRSAIRRFSARKESCSNTRVKLTASRRPAATASSKCGCSNRGDWR